MSEKERKSVTLDPEVADYLGRDEVNASGLVNRLVKMHMNGGDPDNAIREFRKRQLKSEINEYEQRAKMKREELEQINEVAAAHEEEQQSAFEEALETVRDIPAERVHPENPAVITQAQKAGVTPEELLAELRDDEPEPGDLS